MVKYCSKCGNRIQEDANFCNSCGSQNTTNSPSDLQKSFDTVKSSQKKDKLIQYKIGLIGFFVLFLFGFFLTKYTVKKVEYGLFYTLYQPYLRFGEIIVSISIIGILFCFFLYFTETRKTE